MEQYDIANDILSCCATVLITAKEHQNEDSTYIFLVAFDEVMHF